MKKTNLVGILVALLVLMVAACSGPQETATPQPSVPQVPEEPQVTEPEPEGTVEDIEDTVSAGVPESVSEVGSDIEDVDQVDSDLDTSDLEEVEDALAEIENI